VRRCTGARAPRDDPVDDEAKDDGDDDADERAEQGVVREPAAREMVSLGTGGKNPSIAAIANATR